MRMWLPCRGGVGFRGLAWMKIRHHRGERLVQNRHSRPWTHDVEKLDHVARAHPGAAGTRISPVGLRSLKTIPLGAESPIFFAISNSPSGVPRLPGASPIANL